AYVSVAAEPDTGELLGALHARGITVLLPVLGPGLVRCWGRYTGRDDLAQRAPGRPPEPSGEVLPAEALAEAEVVIAPALAIDRRPETPVFAMVHEAELITDDLLPRAEHDQPVDAVITEERWFLLTGSSFSAGA